MIEKYDHHNGMTQAEAMQAQYHRSEAEMEVRDYLHEIRCGRTFKVVHYLEEFGGFEVHCGDDHRFSLDGNTYVLNELIRELSDRYREMCAFLGDPNSLVNRRRLDIFRSEEDDLFAQQYRVKSNPTP